MSASRTRVSRVDVHVRVMYDYQCHPLWVTRLPGEVSSNESPRDLGLTPSLVGRLDAWVHWGESRINMADPHDSRAVTAQEVAAFDGEGRLIAERVGVELPTAVVTYGPDSPSR
jgi:hypothetical protein